MKNKKNKKDIIKLIFIVIGVIIIILLTIYIYSKVSKQSCNCVLYNVNNLSSEEVNDAMGTVKNITAAQTKEALGSDKSIILLDVRTKDEYNQAHIPGSILIPLDELESSAASKLQDKGAAIIVYCRSGARSANASNILVRLGYTNVSNMLGGISGWTYGTE